MNCLNVNLLLHDAACASLDEQLEALVKGHGTDGVSVTEIEEKLGDRGLIRAGILTAKGILVPIRGGGAEPYILTIAD
jgi:hypothetical protein